MTEPLVPLEIQQLRSEIRKLNSRYKSITLEFEKAEHHYRETARIRRQVFDDLRARRRELACLDR